jgi:hypothetical protein
MSSEDEVIQYCIMETKGLCCILLGLSGGEGLAVGHGGGGENKMTGNEIDQSRYCLHPKFGQSEFSCVTASYGMI